MIDPGHILVDRIKTARKYLPPAVDKKLRGLIDVYVGNPKHSGEVDLLVYLYDMTKSFPKYVTNPFYDLYRQVRDDEVHSG